VLQLTRRRDKLDRALGGIKDMGGVPDMLVVIDTNKEDIAVMEARKLGIPVVAVVDSNCDPELITFPIPGNDDAIRAVNFYCDLFARAIIDGLQRELAASGADLGAVAEGLEEELPTDEGDEAAQAADSDSEEAAAQPAEEEAPAAESAEENPGAGA
jgi:small subunit ribosomal protein S2